MPLICMFILPLFLNAQNNKKLVVLSEAETFSPLQIVNIICQSTGSVSVKDGNGREYFSSPASPLISFMAGGATGKHTVTLKDKKGNFVETSEFFVEAKTNIDDGAK
ncbi:MAG: hypothetical protein HC906_16840 [Bacteroidales bacterium]|nr:hypothetical protein [Bacteroidales bacterium]